MRKYLSLAAIIIVAGCNSMPAPKTASQGAYEGTAGFVAALKAANVYAAEPRCSATQHMPCSDQATVNKIVAASNKADTAVIAAQNIVKDSTGSATDVQKANAAANDAVIALVKMVPSSAPAPTPSTTAAQ